MPYVELTYDELVCGKHFCDMCGDCLKCYGDDPCTSTADGEHIYPMKEVATHREETCLQK